MRAGGRTNMAGPQCVFFALNEELVQSIKKTTGEDRVAQGVECLSTTAGKGFAIGIDPLVKKRKFCNLSGSCLIFAAKFTPF